MARIVIDLDEFADLDLEVFTRHATRFATRAQAAAWLIETALYRGKEAMLIPELKPGWAKCLYGKCPSAMPDEP